MYLDRVHGGLLRLQLGWWEVPACSIYRELPISMWYEQADGEEDNNWIRIEYLMPNLEFLGQEENEQLDSLRDELDEKLVAYIHNGWGLKHP